jgi:tellurite resistance protein
MFNAEQILGKMLSGALGSDSHSRGHGLGTLASQLTSGAGLMTLVGLGVGAYEILKGQNASPAGPPPVALSSPQMPINAAPPPLPESGHTLPVIPVPSRPQPTADSVVPSNRSIQGEPPPTGLDGQALAFRMIQAMISAAHADGQVDADEEGKILQRLQEQGMNKEEKLVLLQEMHNPKPIEVLVDGITDAAAAQMMYSVAALAINIDTETEGQWLDRLAKALRISPNMQQFLENI